MVVVGAANVYGHVQSRRSEYRLKKGLYRSDARNRTGDATAMLLG